jgi:hypothetical protein
VKIEEKRKYWPSPKSISLNYYDSSDFQEVDENKNES